MQKYLVALWMIGSLLLAGCGEQLPEQSPSEILRELDATGKITDAQMELLVRDGADYLPYTSQLTRLTSITDAQAESLSELPALSLGGLTSITDVQAESFGQVGDLELDGVTSITCLCVSDGGQAS